MGYLAPTNRNRRTALKQQSPLRKKQNYVQTTHAIEAYISKPTPAQLDAKRRETDSWDKGVEDWSVQYEAKNPIRALAQGFVGGLGLGAAVVAIGAMIIGKPVMFGSMSLLLVVCMLSYLWLDTDNND